MKSATWLCFVVVCQLLHLSAYLPSLTQAQQSILADVNKDDGSDALVNAILVARGDALPTSFAGLKPWSTPHVLAPITFVLDTFTLPYVYTSCLLTAFVHPASRLHIDPELPFEGSSAYEGKDDAVRRRTAGLKQQRVQSLVCKACLLQVSMNCRLGMPWAMHHMWLKRAV